MSDLSSYKIYYSNGCKLDLLFTLRAPSKTVALERIKCIVSHNYSCYHFKNNYQTIVIFKDGVLFYEYSILEFLKLCDKFLNGGSCKWVL